MKNKVPKLRFKEFSGEWEEKKLGEISAKINLKNKENKISQVLTNSATHGILAQTDYFDKDIANINNLDGYYIVNKNDFVYNPRISQYAPVGPINKNNLNTGVMSPLYTVFRFHTENLDFVSKYFSTKFWHKYMKEIANYGARHDRMNITNSDFFKMPINFPSLQEQEKIANFLSSVDTKIEMLEKKKELLSNYKKGMMQKLFSQKLRFKDENGKDYPEWEEKKLGEIGDTFNGITGKNKDDFGKGKPYISYKSVFDSLKIDLNRLEYVNIEENENQNKVKVGDIFFTTSSETPNEIAMSSVLLKEIKECYLNSFCFGYRLKDLDEISPIFLGYYLRSYNIRKKISKLAQGSTRYNISKIELMKLILLLPSFQEQEKIANFLSSIDKKIELVEGELEKNKEFKKGLLQQMFV